MFREGRTPAPGDEQRHTLDALLFELRAAEAELTPLDPDLVLASVRRRLAATTPPSIAPPGRAGAVARLAPLAAAIILAAIILLCLPERSPSPLLGELEAPASDPIATPGRSDPEGELLDDLEVLIGLVEVLGPDAEGEVLELLEISEEIDVLRSEDLEAALNSLVENS